MNQKQAEAKIAALEQENQALRERIAELVPLRGSQKSKVFCSKAFKLF